MGRGLQERVYPEAEFGPLSVQPNPERDKGTKDLNNASLDPASPEQDRCREQEMNGRKRAQKAHRVSGSG